MIRFLKLFLKLCAVGFVLLIVLALLAPTMRDAREAAHPEEKSARLAKENKPDERMKRKARAYLEELRNQRKFSGGIGTIVEVRRYEMGGDGAFLVDFTSAITGDKQYVVALIQNGNDYGLWWVVAKGKKIYDADASTDSNGMWRLR